MNKDDLQVILKEMPEIVDMQEVGRWYIQDLKSAWWHKKDPSNCLERVPNDVIKDDRLSDKYDNATIFNHGHTPSKEEFENLENYCQKVKVNGDNGLVLEKNGTYLYFPEGYYWTSSFEYDEEGRIKPWCVKVNSNGFQYTKDYCPCATLSIRGKE